MSHDMFFFTRLFIVVIFVKNFDAETKYRSSSGGYILLDISTQLHKNI